jgi:hypothetical protein
MNNYDIEHYNEVNDAALCAIEHDENLIVKSGEEFVSIHYKSDLEVLESYLNCRGHWFNTFLNIYNYVRTTKMKNGMYNHVFKRKSLEDFYEYS